MPAILEGDDCPVIVVTNCDKFGVKHPTSQTDPHVQVLAAGTDVTGQDWNGGNSVIQTGTSYSAPLMAGMVATYLASNGIPAATGQLAVAVKNYLRDHANWQWSPPAKVLWNEVDEAHNSKRAGAASTATLGPAPLSTSQTSGPPPAAAPYARGVCGIHVKPTTSASTMDGDYNLEVSMTDDSKTQIDYQQPIQANASHPLDFQSKLEDVLVCVPDSQNKYNAFALGSQQWASNGNFASGAVLRCSMGGLDVDDHTFTVRWRHFCVQYVDFY